MVKTRKIFQVSIVIYTNYSQITGFLKKKKTESLRNRLSVFYEATLLESYLFPYIIIALSLSDDLSIAITKNLN